MFSLPFSSPARCGSLDFNKGATPLLSSPLLCYALLPSSSFLLLAMSSYHSECQLSLGTHGPAHHKICHFECQCQKMCQIECQKLDFGGGRYGASAWQCKMHLKSFKTCLWRRNIQLIEVCHEYTDGPEVRMPCCTARDGKKLNFS